eukprot:TRINITY_DN2714_c0_g1_i4.p1 TRINITY_DN2714_c0_g1~~TRINITY_DN2714_c0_g1_i4.p1  ORF type:complete len:732 (+),score=196.32 TRINITY_DN2714_c0_g1_i4:274-2196(+)
MWSPLNAYGTGRWGKVDMSSGVQDFVWTFQTPHSSRDFRYWVTKRGWNPDAPLTRAQFEAEPFCKVEYFGRLPGKKETHSCNVPRRSGYHVILSTWDVADTPNAFYAVVDANFGGVDIPLPPTPPTPPVTPAPTPQPTPWPAPPVVDGCRDLTGAGGKPWYPLKWGLEWTCSKYFAADPERTETRCADYSAAVWANAETGTHAGQACCVCGGGEAVGPQPSTQPPATPKPTQEPVPEPTPEPTQEPTTCEASTRAGYDCMQATTVGTVFWRLARDGASVDLALEVAGSGYAALGFGDGMVGADVAIAQTTVGRFDIASRSRAGITASDKTVSDASVTRADGTTFLAFSWPVESTFAVMVAAYHSSSTSLRYHGGLGRAVFGVDFAAVPKATAVPPTPKPTTAVPPTPQPTTAVPPTPQPTVATDAPTPQPTAAPASGDMVWWPAFSSRSCRPGTAARGAELNKPMYETRAECCEAHKARMGDFNYCMTRDWGVTTPATPKPTATPAPTLATLTPATDAPTRVALSMKENDGERVEAVAGSIEDGWGEAYEIDQDLAVTVVGKNCKLSFREFALQHEWANASCQANDWVEIRTRFSRVKILCGRRLPDDMELRGEEFTVSFHTDAREQGLSGFVLDFTCEA